MTNNTIPFTLRINPDLNALIGKKADMLGISKNAVIKILLHQQLEKELNNKKES